MLSATMYADFFGLKHPPFSIAPDPRYLFMSERHREALAHLMWGVNAGGGFVLLTGDIGAGKTTVCRCFLEQLPPHCRVAYIFNPRLTVQELLQTICQEFGLPALQGADGATKPLIDALNQHLLQAHAQGESCLLIIDEAQNLSADVLEQLRLLTNLETSERKLLQIILIGQPELRDILARPELEQLAQRVVAQCHLQALSPGEVRQYIQHRLAVSGWQGPVPFDEAALMRIQRWTQGVPRRINLLCDRALLGAYARQDRRVSKRMVDEAAVEVFQIARTPSSRRGRSGLRLGAALVLGGLTLAGLTWWASGRSSLTSTGSLATNRPALSAPLASAPPLTSSSAPSQGVLVVSSKPDVEVSALAPVSAWLVAEESVWSMLAGRWGGRVESGKACTVLVEQQLRCYRGLTGVQTLKLLNRPAALYLHDVRGQKGVVILLALRGDLAQIQHREGRQWVRWADVASLWRGDFATLWRAGESWMVQPEALGGAALLAALHQAESTALGTMPEPSHDSLAEAVMRFQARVGLRPDGRPSALTMMMLNQANGVNEPRLSEER